MSRLRLFLKGVSSSYVALTSTVVCSLISVPLALHYLTREQFGLWAVLTQITSYLSLVDLGMSPSVGRLLIERKDCPRDGAYGGLIQTGFWVTVTQAALVLLAGLALASALASLFKIPEELQPMFCGLVRWQTLITASMFATRIFRNLLYAHQRNDWINYAQAIASFVGLSVLWLALRRGGGVPSVLWANAAALGVAVAVLGWCCIRLRLFPSRGAWGASSWQEFKAVFCYGKDVFIVHVGSLLIMTAQTIIISRQLGLEAVAVWSVGTKAFFLLCSVIWQVFDASTPAFAEMLVREEWERLRVRFTGLLIISATLAGVAAVLYGACNSAFVTVWTHGQIVWPWWNDVLLGGWMIISALIHANCGFVIVTKRIAGMRYVLLIEGLVFCVVASLVARRGGLPAIIGASLLGSLCFSGVYGMWRINRYFNFHTTELERRWLLRLGKILGFLVPVGAGGWWLASSVGGWVSLIVSGAVVSLVGAYLELRFGVPSELRVELFLRLSPHARRILERLL